MIRLSVYFFWLWSGLTLNLHLLYFFYNGFNITIAPIISLFFISKLNPPFYISLQLNLYSLYILHVTAIPTQKYIFNVTQSTKLCFFFSPSFHPFFPGLLTKIHFVSKLPNQAHIFYITLTQYISIYLFYSLALFQKLSKKIFPLSPNLLHPYYNFSHSFLCSPQHSRSFIHVSTSQSSFIWFIHSFI